MRCRPVGLRASDQRRAETGERYAGWGLVVGKGETGGVQSVVWLL